MIVCDQSVSKALYQKQQKEEMEEEKEEKEEKEETEEEEKKMEEEKEEKEKEKEEKKPRVIGDAEEGKTVFVRNIPMDATQKDLFRFFKRYGRLVYVKLCQDK